MDAALVVIVVMFGLLLAGSWLGPRCPRVDRWLHVALGGSHESWGGKGTG